ncbi:MAG: DNA mismatch repair protein MutS [Gemmatimonadaceae bacterium]|nr:DNA mismatch repair protein MutS [Chitinophagaceae bacterium]
MQIDKTTFSDLSIFHHEEEFSLFHKINFTKTSVGREWLVRFFAEPFNDIKKINETQDILKCILRKESEWMTSITNGTIMMMERFYESPVDTIPDSANLLNGYTYKFLHGPDYSLVRYSVGHFADFVRGFQKLVTIFENEECPTLLRAYLDRAKDLLKDDILKKLSLTAREATLTPVQTIYFGNHLRYKFKTASNELINIYGRLDAWYSMAVAVTRNQMSFPVMIDSPKAVINAKSLYHILLPNPVAYDVTLEKGNNFLFLTGANMAGKSTFIKSVGAALYLAHLGMGVPAKEMELTLFDGILSNINVVDNIVKGESYFFNEVQRIKNTILKINNGKKWLVLIDELFKGTNVQDAMKCSLTVIKGLIKIPNSLFILSTHLYEIGDELKEYPNIIFRYFETTVDDDQLVFSYQLKEGISNDRLGYLILKKEKVVELLEKL